MKKVADLVKGAFVVLFITEVVVGVVTVTVVGSTQKEKSGKKNMVKCMGKVMKNSTCVAKVKCMGKVQPCRFSMRSDFNHKGFGAGREICVNEDPTSKSNWSQIL